MIAVMVRCVCFKNVCEKLRSAKESKKNEAKCLEKPITHVTLGLNKTQASQNIILLSFSASSDALFGVCQ